MGQLQMGFALAVAAIACKSEPPATALVQEQRRISQEPARVSTGGKDLLLTGDKLDRYLLYQKRMVALYSGLLKETGTIAKGRGTQVHRRELTPSRQGALEKLAAEEERARAQSGLSLEELSAMEQIVREVIGKRIYGAALSEDESVQRMEEMKAKLPAEWQAETEKSIAEIRRSQEAIHRLPEERSKYGNANVDIVLSREAELTRAWKETVALFAKDPKN
jgi:hypothetical protein